MPNHASVSLIGHLGRDPELKFLQTGTALLKWSLAVSTGYGEKRATTWWNCTMFGQRCEKLAEMLAKGQAIHVTGEPSLREYDGREGGKRQSLDVRVSDVTLLGKDTPRTATPEDDDIEAPL
jgi:single-strand DNA-binding protein